MSPMWLPLTSDLFPGVDGLEHDVAGGQPGRLVVGDTVQQLGTHHLQRTLETRLGTTGCLVVVVIIIIIIMNIYKYTRVLELKSTSA